MTPISTSWPTRKMENWDTISLMLISMIQITTQITLSTGTTSSTLETVICTWWKKSIKMRTVHVVVRWKIQSLSVISPSISTHSMFLLSIYTLNWSNIGMKAINFGSHQLKDSYSQPMISWFSQKTESMFLHSARKKRDPLRIRKVLLEWFTHSAPATTWKLSQRTIFCLPANSTTIDRFASKSNIMISNLRPNSKTFSKLRYMKLLLENLCLSNRFMHVRPKVTSSY